MTAYETARALLRNADRYYDPVTPISYDELTIKQRKLWSGAALRGQRFISRVEDVLREHSRHRAGV